MAIIAIGIWGLLGGRRTAGFFAAALGAFLALAVLLLALAAVFLVVVFGFLAEDFVVFFAAICFLLNKKYFLTLHEGIFPKEQRTENK
jgi:hypothetical protein